MRLHALELHHMNIKVNMNSWVLIGKERNLTVQYCGQFWLSLPLLKIEPWEEQEWNINLWLPNLVSTSLQSSLLSCEWFKRLKQLLNCDMTHAQENRNVQFNELSPSKNLCNNHPGQEIEHLLTAQKSALAFSQSLCFFLTQSKHNPNFYDSHFLFLHHLIT